MYRPWEDFVCRVFAVALGPPPPSIAKPLRRGAYKMLQGDHAPNFPLQHAHKDMSLAVAAGMPSQDADDQQQANTYTQT